LICSYAFKTLTTIIDGFRTCKVGSSCLIFSKSWHVGTINIGRC